MGSSVRGKENTEVIVNLGGGGESGSGRPAGLPLFDGKGGGEAFYGIDRRSGELGKVMSCVSRKTFQVSALALGVDGVKCEGSFS